MNTTMYDRLLRLPLFQGLSRRDLTDILEKIKVEFKSYKKKEIIVNQGTPCMELIYILSGEVKSSTTDSSQNFRLSEVLGSNTILEPHSLFGMNTFYRSSYQAAENVDIVVIKKGYILSYLCKYEIFNLNFLNILSNRAQIMQDKLLNTHIGSIQEKIVNFLVLRCSQLTGCKELFITMEDFANLIDETRINVSKTLNALQEEGLISLSRKCIRIPDLNALYTKTNGSQKQETSM